MCRAELRTLKEIYSEYQDDITIIGIGFDVAQNIDQLNEYRRKQDYPWVMAVGTTGLIRELKVRIHSTKIGINMDGVIEFRKGYGNNSITDWRRFLNDML